MTQYSTPATWPSDDELYEGGKYDRASFGDLGFALQLAKSDLQRIPSADRATREYAVANIGRIYRELDLYKQQFYTPRPTRTPCVSRTAAPTRTRRT